MHDTGSPGSGLRSSPVAFNLVRYAGAGYLVYLGARMLLAKNAALAGDNLPRPEALSKIFYQGVITNVLNPKVAMFFLAFLPQFINPKAGVVALQITALGLRPARRATSTAASVWPARTSTPPGRATSGKTCPGETKASGPLPASMATAIVRARSAALIPVEMPSFASIDTVKAVSLRLRLVRVIGSRPS